MLNINVLDGKVTSVETVVAPAPVVTTLTEGTDYQVDYTATPDQTGTQTPA